jgi:predicted phosphodiesterase
MAMMSPTAGDLPEPLRQLIMKIAFLSDIHGNFTALKAVDNALTRESPDTVIVGGDLTGNGGMLPEVIDLIRVRGWPCIAGNTDEMLWQPERLDALAARVPRMARLWDILRDDVGYAIDAIGAERLEWLEGLLDRWTDDRTAVVHASPGDKWSSPAGPDASDEELVKTFASLARPDVVFGHIHVPFVRRVGAMTVANSGSVGMPYDGDPRAAFLIIDDGAPAIRRVAYDVEAEVASRRNAGYPHAEWVGRILRRASFVLP